jgi:hypothetical protein
MLGIFVRSNRRADIPNIKMKGTEDASAAGLDAREAPEASSVGHSGVDIILEHQN